MPELPEVEIVVRQLLQEEIMQEIIQVDVSDTVRRSKAEGKEAIIKGEAVDSFVNQLTGTTIEAVRRRSKYIYFSLRRFDQAYLLVNHLGMTGAWFIVESVDEIKEDKFQRHIHLVFHLKNGLLLVYCDIRRFGEFRLLRDEADYPPLLLLAPEPFDLNAEQFFIDQMQSKRSQKRMIKAAIMDGKNISGCGNIYATEALFKEKIRPDILVHLLTEQQLRQLFQQIIAILKTSIDRGGSSISDYRNINGESGTMQGIHQMYNKKTCAVCGTDTQRIIIEQRTSTFCPVCQKGVNA